MNRAAGLLVFPDKISHFNYCCNESFMKSAGLFWILFSADIFFQQEIISVFETVEETR